MKRHGFELNMLPIERRFVEILASDKTIKADREKLMEEKEFIDQLDHIFYELFIMNQSNFKAKYDFFYCRIRKIFHLKNIGDEEISVTEFIDYISDSD